jgi:thiamine pyrophosphokinase
MLNSYLVNDKIVGLFLNGGLPDKLPCLSNYCKIFAVNGAYNYLYKHNIVPDFVLGDMDSINNVNITSKSLFIKTMNQELTDFEKALQIIISKNFINIDVWGGVGGEDQDHFIGNLFVALKYIRDISLVFYDTKYYIFFVDQSIKLYNVRNKIISFFPFPIVSNISSQGLKYELLDTNFKLGKNMGIRNIAIRRNVKLFFQCGMLLLFVQR